MFRKFVKPHIHLLKRSIYSGYEYKEQLLKYCDKNHSFDLCKYTPYRVFRVDLHKDDGEIEKVQDMFGYYRNSYNEMFGYYRNSYNKIPLMLKRTNHIDIGAMIYNRSPKDKFTNIIANDEVDIFDKFCLIYIRKNEYHNTYDDTYFKYVDNSKTITGNPVMVETYKGCKLYVIQKQSGDMKNICKVYLKENRPGYIRHCDIDKDIKELMIDDYYESCESISNIDLITHIKNMRKYINF